MALTAIRIQCIDVIVDNSASLNASMCYNTHGGAPPSRTSPAAKEENKEADATSESTSQGSSITAPAYCVLWMAIGIAVLVF